MQPVDTSVLSKVSDSFASVSFDSYKDNTLLIKCLDNLHSRILSDMTEGMYDGSTLFTVTDIAGCEIRGSLWY